MRVGCFGEEGPRGRVFEEDGDGEALAFRFVIARSARVFPGCRRGGSRGYWCCGLEDSESCCEYLSGGIGVAGGRVRPTGGLVASCRFEGRNCVDVGFGGKKEDALDGFVGRGGGRGRHRGGVMDLWSQLEEALRKGSLGIGKAELKTGDLT